MAEAERCLKNGAEFPYHDKPPADWAESAACGILWDLSDRGGIKHELSAIDEDIRAEIVAALAAIIRAAYLASRAP